MDINRFFPDTLTIESSSIEVRVQIMKSGELLVFGDEAPIVVDDILTRTLKNGVVENYHVLDAIYQAGHGPHLPATTKLRVQKQGVKNPRSAPQQITYSVTGANSRINVQSQDHSTNVVNVTTERLFSDLKTLAGDKAVHRRIRRTYCLVSPECATSWPMEWISQVKCGPPNPGCALLLSRGTGSVSFPARKSLSTNLTSLPRSFISRRQSGQIVTESSLRIEAPQPAVLRSPSGTVIALPLS